jgi:hypothetical protein
MIGLVLVAAAVVALLPAPTSRPGASGAGPRVGDHWHAILVITMCGEVQPPLAEFGGEVHTHGDGLVHIHPSTPQWAGANANLERFFAQTGILLTTESLQLPGGRLYRNGDLCADGSAGQVRVFLNDGPVSDLRAVVPRDGDLVRVEFLAGDEPPR